MISYLILFRTFVNSMKVNKGRYPINKTLCPDVVRRINQSNNLLLIHWGRVTHICVGNLTIIGSDNGLSPGRRQAPIWTNAGILLIGPLGTNFSEILIEIQIFLYMKMHLKMSSAKWRPFCLGLNMLTIEKATKYSELSSAILYSIMPS